MWTQTLLCMGKDKSTRSDKCLEIHMMHIYFEGFFLIQIKQPHLPTSLFKLFSMYFFIYSSKKAIGTLVSLFLQLRKQELTEFI
jgi:hypothetical protein